MSTSPYAISIVEPVTIANGMVLSSNISETDYAAWNSGSTYALGDRVILTSTHRIYESLQGSNLNKNPVTETTYWIEVSPTNKWKCFDTSSTTQTLATGISPPTITYELDLGQAVNCVAFLNVSGCNHIHIVMDDPVYGIVYDETVSLARIPLSSDWWAWFFGSRREKNQHVALDLPTYPNATITVTLDGTPNLGVGVIMFGQQQNFSLGMQYGARLGIQDYSRKETNDFGDTVFVVRAFAKRATYDVFLENEELDSFQKYLASIRAVPCLWVGSNSFEATTVFGFYKNFDILLNYPHHSECSLDIEGLT